MALIATFFSHFGAVRFSRLARSRGADARPMPVPRSLSSSCGTCVRFDRSPLAADEPWPEEIELVVEETGDAAAPFRELYRAEGC